MPIRLEAGDVRNYRHYPCGVTIYAVNPLALELASGLKKRGFGVVETVSSLPSFPPGAVGERKLWAAKFTPDGYEVFSLMQNTREFRLLGDVHTKSIPFGFKPDSDHLFQGISGELCWSEEQRLQITAFGYSRISEIALNTASSIQQPDRKESLVELWFSLRQRIKKMLEPGNLLLLSETGLFELINPAIDHYMPDPGQEEKYAAEYVGGEFTRDRIYFMQRYRLSCAT